ncbi:MAG: cupin domain-containing protein [Marinobacter sp.]|nr:cupin domain-containing protein [Marinobacter sp.]
MQLPGGMPVATFLRDYWQKKPLVIRGAFPGFECPVSPDELAGLACEEAVESRLVIELEDGKPWQLHNGPFSPQRFERLPASPWTLLVQGLDHWVPDVADLLEQFRFIPNWRLDDIMASFAPPGGSVGPHYDQYDVFLLQAQGRRRWQFGGNHDTSSPRVEGTPLRILKDPSWDEDVILEPGDMLYLPPAIGHHGVALDDCITLSIGFRAPTQDDLLTSYTDYLSSQPGADRHLNDPDLQPQTNPGEITPAAIERLQRLITEAMNDPRQLGLWFGQYATSPKSEDIVQPPEEPITPADLYDQLNSGGQLRWNEGSRFAWHGLGLDELALFVDGERYLLSGDARPLATLLCEGNQVANEPLLSLLADTTLCELVTHLHNQGSVYIEWD